MSQPSPERTRSDAVAAELRDAILRGDHRPGDRLPPERELAARLGVGRSSVREAVARLAQLGLVEIRHGGGAIVRPVADANVEVLRHLLVLDGEPDLRLLGEFLDVSELLLTALVRFAVERATDAELTRAHELIERMTDPAGGDDEYFDAIEELMQLVAEASRHRVLRFVRNGLRAILNDEGRRGRAGRLRPPREELLPVARDLHRAIDDRDADAAVLAAQRLVRAGREQFLKRVEARRARAR
jgi:GntR family transcriptional repressor for pyruvate dehydrogenase complex